ncbi:DNA-binding CsgD family transcriptional regulator [Catenuloplanes atrovinosus]|uniref:DNA-binding CsgD family transcriptional regulator n=2 Tax=Catenuloplanes atrovinosus TaxID=137266 RepID=A0AAE4CBV0_9ACTN|nr:DNA-binding CsgD family transcriptional regulator [Catenuloplanes atrovinosus]
MRHVQVTGSEFEGQFPFAGLHQLCHPLLGHLVELPSAQAGALRRALGIADDATAPDGGRPLLVAAVRGLLAAAARTQPLICVVDDAQWLDAGSLAVLLLVAQRIGDLPVALLLVARDDEVLSAARTRELPGLELTGLADADARDLLAAEVNRPLDPAVRDRFIAEAGGNPLALLELPRTVNPAALAGGYATPPPSTLSASLEAHFVALVAQMPDETRRLLLLAAAEPTGDPATLWCSAGALGLTEAAAQPAQDAGLLAVDARVRFRHPLVRSAVYHAADPADRRVAHRALAHAYDARQDRDRRAWHLALAAEAPDDAVAAELVCCAHRARSRGGLTAMAAFLERAAILTPDRQRRSALLVKAAQAKREAGLPDEATALLDVARAGRLDRHHRIAADVLQARISLDRRRDLQSVRMLVDAGLSAARQDADLAREVLFEAYAAAVFVGRFGDTRLLARIGSAMRGLGPGESGSGRSLTFSGLLTEATDGLDAAALTLRLGIARYLDEAALPLGTGDVWLAYSAAAEFWDDESMLRISELQLAAVRENGALASLPVALMSRALTHIHNGEFAEAERLSAECAAVTAELGVPAMTYVDTTLAAWRGDEAGLLALYDVAFAEATARGEGRVLTALDYALAVLRNGQGRYTDAMAVCAQAEAQQELGIRTRIPLEFIEAAVRAGRRDLAVPAFERLERRASASSTDWAAGTLAHARALISEGDEAERHYLTALDRLAASDAAPQLARVHLLYGEWLRRHRRKREARAQLEIARDRFIALGAKAFAQRASRELAAAGERPVVQATGPGRLTAQEEEIARLAAEGATTREIAHALYLSPRTVDTHLRNVFTKLGLTSRRQLSRHPAGIG